MTSNLVGETIGGYRLAAQIGSGALATVYKAYQPDLKRWVAIKILQYRDKDALVRFQREAQAIARLRHRNILIVYNYGEEGEWPYIVMEYIEGGTLADRLKGDPIDWVRAVDLMIPIAEALGYAHQQGVIHRDVKPSNILMAQEDWPLLADFGLIKLKDDAKNKGLTGPGTSMGTPFYIAPEQARGQTVDHRADIYSIGVILYEMITGRLPFDYQNPNKVLLAHISEPVPPPRQFNADCPVIVEKIILNAMQKSPDQRYKDMLAVKEVLKEALHSSDARLAFYVPPPSKPIQTRELIPAVPIPDSESDTQPPAQPPPDIRLFLLEKKVSLPLPSNQTSLVIGRTYKDTVADIDLGPYGGAEAGVSRLHARLTFKNNEWFIDDLGSLNGTFVNDKKVIPGDPSAPLQDGDELRFSHLTCLFLVSS